MISFCMNQLNFMVAYVLSLHHLLMFLPQHSSYHQVEHITLHLSRPRVHIIGRVTFHYVVKDGVKFLNCTYEDVSNLPSNSSRNS